MVDYDTTCFALAKEINSLLMFDLTRYRGDVYLRYNPTDGIYVCVGDGTDEIVYRYNRRWEAMTIEELADDLRNNLRRVPFFPVNPNSGQRLLERIDSDLRKLLVLAFFCYVALC